MTYLARNTVKWLESWLKSHGVNFPWGINFPRPLYVEYVRRVLTELTFTFLGGPSGIVIHFISLFLMYSQKIIEGRRKYQDARTTEYSLRGNP